MEGTFIHGWHYNSFNTNLGPRPTIRMEKLEEGIRDSVRLKNKFESHGEVYKTVVRPAMMNGADTRAVKKAQEKKLDGAEMRMLRWMSGVTKLDRIRNERIRGTTKVGEISKKVQESRLKWYGHVLRREDGYARE